MSDKDQLKDSQYDGIQEYDNDLPKWWVGTFIITVLFGFGYWLYFYTFGGPGQVAKYEKAYQAHQEKYTSQNNAGDINDDVIVAMVDSVSDLESGKTIFTQNCVACHAANGGGGIGPNLTDKYWIHDDSPRGVFETVQNGVVEKGMLAWKGILTTQQMQQVSAYVVSLKNTNVEGGKEPQGDLVE
ncbi:MAG: c-type cytochrome [Deltaproteobacteria bacterium]|nr:c-type cytochrome [Deltaproteobacteria bacterium]